MRSTEWEWIKNTIPSCQMCGNNNSEYMIKLRRWRYESTQYVCFNCVRIIAEAYKHYDGDIVTGPR